MPEPRDPRSLVESAEESAAAGDHASAERLLREAALLQEATLGPSSPDLANTLNNLGVLYEMNNRPADAEDCYRRAYAIAKAILAPDHPFVATSGQNLRDFREARGRPVDTPVEASAPVPSPAAEQESAPTPAPVALSEGVPDVPRERSSHEDSPPRRRSFRPLAIGVICACVLVVVALIVARAWFGPTAGAGFSQDETKPPLGVSPEPRPVPAAPIPRPTDPATSTSRPTGERESPRTSASGVALPSVAELRVCRSLSTRGSGGWRCDPVTASVEPGTLFFYTKLKSANDTTVEHRWFRGEHLHQAVELPIRANAGSGYRTYSRNTVRSVNAGDWRVELRAKDGTLLGEERFTVR